MRIQCRQFVVEEIVSEEYSDISDLEYIFKSLKEKRVVFSATINIRDSINKYENLKISSFNEEDKSVNLLVISGNGSMSLKNISISSFLSVVITSKAPVSKDESLQMSIDDFI